MAMRTRPTRFGSSIRLFVTRNVIPRTAMTRKATVTFMAVLVAVGAFAATRPAQAAWEGSGAEQAVITGLDMLIVRPLAAVRAGVGTVLLVPAAIIASPGCLVNLVDGADCRGIYEAPYEVLVNDTYEYAFRRPMGEL